MRKKENDEKKNEKDFHDYFSKRRSASSAKFCITKRFPRNLASPNFTPPTTKWIVRKIYESERKRNKGMVFLSLVNSTSFSIWMVKFVFFSSGKLSKISLLKRNEESKVKIFAHERRTKLRPPHVSFPLSKTSRDPTFGLMTSFFTPPHFTSSPPLFIVISINKTQVFFVYFTRKKNPRN